MKHCRNRFFSDSPVKGGIRCPTCCVVRSVWTNSFFHSHISIYSMPRHLILVVYFSYRSLHSLFELIWIDFHHFIHFSMICQDFRLYYIHANELVRELPHKYFRLSASSSDWLDSNSFSLFKNSVSWDDLILIVLASEKTITKKLNKFFTNYY